MGMQKLLCPLPSIKFKRANVVVPVASKGFHYRKFEQIAEAVCSDGDDYATPFDSRLILVIGVGDKNCSENSREDGVSELRCG